MQSWMLIGIVVICVMLFVAFGFALWSTKKPPILQHSSVPKAQELLGLLRSQENTLQSLRKYSQIACEYYGQYMREYQDFDLEFVAIRTAHKNVNAQLILEIERHFKSLNPSRKGMLDKALTSALGRR